MRCLTDSIFTSAAHGTALKKKKKGKHQKDHPPLQTPFFTLPNDEEWDNSSRTQSCAPLTKVYALNLYVSYAEWIQQSAVQAVNCMQASTNLKCGKRPRNLSPKTNVWNSTTLFTRTWRHPNNRLEQPRHIWCFSESPVGMAHTNLCNWQASSFHTEDQENPRNSPGQWETINNFKARGIKTIFLFEGWARTPIQAKEPIHIWHCPVALQF